jgi:hypothetical protein
MQEISELAIKEGCYTIPSHCPDPIIWLVIGVVVGLWISSVFWMAYIHRMQMNQKETGDSE